MNKLILKNIYIFIFSRSLQTFALLVHQYENVIIFNQLNFSRNFAWGYCRKCKNYFVDELLHPVSQVIDFSFDD